MVGRVRLERTTIALKVRRMDNNIMNINNISEQQTTYSPIEHQLCYVETHKIPSINPATLENRRHHEPTT